jgi:Flp pilus assembly protein TadB
MRITLRCPRYLKDQRGYRLTATVLTAAQVLEAQSEKPAPAPQPAPGPVHARPPTSKPQLPPAKHFGISAGLWAAIVGIAHWAGMKALGIGIVALCALLLILFFIHYKWENKK